MIKLAFLAKSLVSAASSRFHAYQSYSSEFGVMGALFLGLQKVARVRNIVLPIKGLTKWVHLRSEGSDFLVLRQVIGKRDCLVPLTCEPKFIVDAGANVGYTSMLFAERYPKAFIVAIEPDEENFKQLCKNCSAYENIRPLKCGLWYESGLLQISNRGEMSWELQVAAHHDGPITAVTVGDIMTEFGQSKIDLLKIDIEGAELELFQHASPWLSNVRHLLIELHEHIRPGCSAVFKSAVENYEFIEHRAGEYVFTTFR